MTDSEILERLDKMLAILQLAHYEQIESARQRIRMDGLNAAILDGASKRISAGGLIKKAEASAGGPSGSTVKRRIAALVDQGALDRSGAGPTTAYEATGLV
jgi:hypothetical protein